MLPTDVYIHFVGLFLATMVPHKMGFPPIYCVLFSLFIILAREVYKALTRPVYDWEDATRDVMAGVLGTIVGILI
jgi:hypothetical protein